MRCRFVVCLCRARVLKRMLDREQLYLTDIGKSACEAAARANMSHEWRLAFAGQLMQANGLGRGRMYCSSISNDSSLSLLTVSWSCLEAVVISMLYCHLTQMFIFAVLCWARLSSRLRSHQRQWWLAWTFLTRNCYAV